MSNQDTFLAFPDPVTTKVDVSDDATIVYETEATGDVDCTEVSVESK